MRLTSEFFVAATLRRVASEGGFAALRRRGEGQAGAIYVLVDCLDGTGALFGPAPQSSYDDKPSERFFTRLHKEERVSLAVIEARLEKELRFDPDCFVIEIEDRQGRPFVEMIP
jgi:hypothetical protein